jgi:hypothetical protein
VNPTVETNWSIDRPRAYAIVLSAITKQTYLIPDIETFSWRKSDNGDAGSFSLSTPLQQNYEDAVISTDRMLPYAKVAGPMDLIAIYANRAALGWRQDRNVTPLSLLPATTGLAYGGDGGKTVQKLGTDTCICIGMVDTATCSKDYSAKKADFHIQGKDLTKIFLINDILIPASSIAAQAGANPTQGAGSFSGLQLIQLIGNTTGSALIQNALDIFVAKTQGYAEGYPTNVAQNLATFGFPWRDFVLTTQLNANFFPLAKSLYPPFQAQSGSTWANILELRNAPQNRLFIDEIGRLRFDDAYSAWTQLKPSGTIGGEDIRSFETTMSDEDLITFLSVYPNQHLGSATDIVNSLGTNSSNGFVNGVAEASNANQASVRTFGYRFGQFQSLFAPDFAAAKALRKVLIEFHNNLFTGSLVVRGLPNYRVGNRYLVLDTTGRPEVTNAIWYVSEIEHHFAWGSDYTTTMTLKYPSKGNTTLAGQVQIP